MLSVTMQDLVKYFDGAKSCSPIRREPFRLLRTKKSSWRNSAKISQTQYYLYLRFLSELFSLRIEAKWFSLA